MNSLHVKFIQRYLTRETGFALRETGLFDKATCEIYSRYQSLNGKQDRESKQMPGTLKDLDPKMRTYVEAHAEAFKTASLNDDIGLSDSRKVVVQDSVVDKRETVVFNTPPDPVVPAVEEEKLVRQFEEPVTVRPENKPQRQMVPKMVRGKR